jgi:conjugative transfer region lipoprotein (TIGR03751 family)
MNTILKKITILSLISSTVLLSGCASNKDWDSGSGVSMASVYETQMHQSNTSTLTSARSEVSGIPTNTTGITAISAETNNNFVLLPNPTIALYVYPHLVNGNIPVPAYTTQFTLYTNVHYALPGEVPVLGGNYAQ